MNDWTPGDGWREVRTGEIVGDRECLSHSTGAGGVNTLWVREAPVPPLPTTPYTIIRVTWDPKHPRYSGRVLIKLPPDEYHEWSFGGNDGDGYGSTEKLRREITGFEVLAEPCSQHYGHEDLEKVRRETAEAVLDAAKEFFDRAWTPGNLRVLPYDMQQALFAHIRSEFGVQS